MEVKTTERVILNPQRLSMTNKQPTSNSYCEIVRYNSRIRKDLEVLPDRVRGLSEVNHKVDTLNALLRASKEDGRGDVIYYRRKVRA